MATGVILEMQLECVLGIGCSFLAAILLAMLLLIVSDREQQRKLLEMEEQKDGEIIYVVESPSPYVVESPSPTMHMSFPRPSPFLTHRKVRKAGRARLPMHRRAITIKYDQIPNDCGYECMLRAGGLVPTKAYVRRF